MKKVLAVFLIMFMLLAVTGCGKEEFEVRNDNGVTTRVTEKIKKTIRNVDEKKGNYILLGIDEIKLSKTGNLYFETDDLLEHLGDDILVDSNVKDVYLLSYGNAGQRVILFIKNDGSLSAVNMYELTVNKKIIVVDNIGSYKNVKKVQSINNEIQITLKDNSTHIINGLLI